MAEQPTQDRTAHLVLDSGLSLHAHRSEAGHRFIWAWSTGSDHDMCLGRLARHPGGRVAISLCEGNGDPRWSLSLDDDGAPVILHHLESGGYEVFTLEAQSTEPAPEPASEAEPDLADLTG